MASLLFQLRRGSESDSVPMLQIRKLLKTICAQCARFAGSPVFPYKIMYRSPRNITTWILRVAITGEFKFSLVAKVSIARLFDNLPVFL